ncbi:MAG TPA: hypothetical protein PKL31_00475 [Fulvivirga sp.]|nr:hypothetical protein [Fulvivirga sp.]
MKRILLLLMLSAPALFYSCTSGKKAYEKGDYYSAVLKSVDRLRKNPNHKKSKEALRNSYPLALQKLEQNATNTLNSNREFKYGEALNYYNQINRLYNEIRASPGALSVISNPKNYIDNVASLKEKAAKESYDAAVLRLNRDTREDAKSAYFMFRDANNYVPNYKDALKKMEEAKFMATLKVVVEQIPVPQLYNLSGAFFQDKIEEYLHSHYRSNEFVRFYTPREADTEKLPFVDQYMRLQFDDFVVGETHTEKNTETVSKDSVKVGSVTLEDGTKVDAYNTVTAKITTFKKQVVSKGLFSMQILDANTKAVLNHRKFTGEYVWFTQWGSFNGDERALTDEQLAICQNREVPPPQPQFLFIEFTRPIYDQLVTAVNSFYGNY